MKYKITIQRVPIKDKEDKAFVTFEVPDKLELVFARNGQTVATKAIAIYLQSVGAKDVKVS